LAGYLAPLYSRTLPDFYGSLGFVGAKGFFACSTFFFAAAGFFSSVHDVSRRRGDDSTPVILLLGLTAAALFAKRFGALGINWIGALPILRLVIFDKYEEAVIGCCIALLAGFGVARLCANRITPASLWLAALIPLLVLTAAASERRQPADAIVNMQYYALSLSAALLFLGLTVALVATFRLRRLKVSQLAFAALILVLAEPLATYIIPLYYFINGQAPQSASPLLGAPYVDYLKSHLVNGDRLYAQDGLLFPQWSEAFALADVRGMNGFYPERYLPFVRSFVADRGPGANNLSDRFIGIGDDATSSSSQRFFALSSVRYVLALSDLTHSPDYRKIDAFREAADAADSARFGLRIFQFRAPLPRAAVFHRVILVPDPQSALREITGKAFDPYSEVVVESNDKVLAPLSQNPRTAVSAADIEKYEPNFVRASVTTDSPALLVLNDTNFPGWQALVDGRSSPIYYANYLFRGVVVPAGTHVVEFRYAPRSFAIGLLISVISLLLLLCVCLVGFFLRSRTSAYA